MQEYTFRVTVNGNTFDITVKSVSSNQSKARALVQAQYPAATNISLVA